MAMFAIAGVIIALSLAGKRPGPRTFLVAGVSAAMAGLYLYASS